MLDAVLKNLIDIGFDPPAWKIHSHACRGAGLINEEIAWFSSSINA